MTKWFHSRIRDARDQAGLSQEDLAEKLGVTGATISNWENRVSEPRDEQRERAIAWAERIENGPNRGRARRTGAHAAKDDSDEESSNGAIGSLRQVYEYWPQSRIAEALSVSQATVSNWLRTGSVNAKYTDTLRRLSGELQKESRGGTVPAKTSEGDVEETQYGEWLRSELERQELNAVELAQRSGVHVNTILALLEGQTEKPQQRTRHRIEKVLQAKGTPLPEPEAGQEPWYYTNLDWTSEEIDQAPDEPGVYMIHDRLGRPAYIGVAHKGAGGIRGRLRKHNELRWTSDRRVAYKFSYALSARIPRSDPYELAKALEKLLIKFMGNAILINEREVENIAEK